MDYQEAIERHIEECKHRIDVIADFMEEDKDSDKGKCTENIRILKTAVSAMQELRALHDQGISMERLKDIDFRKRVVEHINYDAYMSMQEDVEEYKQLGTLEEVQEAVEKQMAKKPTYEGDGYAPDGTFVWDEWICPRCGSRFEVDYEEHGYCPYCGQHIDWSEEE